MNLLKKILLIVIALFTIVSLSLALTGCPPKSSTKVSEVTKETTIETEEKITEESVEETTPEETTEEEGAQPTGQIAFESDRDDGNDEIYVMNADGSEQIRLTDNPADDFSPAFQP